MSIPNQKNKLLSICIPTYNRADYLQKCLDSITYQFSQKDVYQRVEIIISNNNSKDKTEEVVKKFQEKFKNIRYYKNKRNIGNENTIKVADYAHGDYIWFFSDDDFHKNDSLIRVLTVIQKYKPDAICCNLDLSTKAGDEILDPNLLRIKQDIYLKNKRELFSLLETKFFLPIDWYITSYSNTIIKREIFKKNRWIAQTIINKRSLAAFPHISFIYYDANDYKIYIISKPLLNFRADNRSFGPKNKMEFLIYWYKALNLHYRKIYKINRKNISMKFVFLLALKNFTRSLRLVFLKLFRFDISDILIKLFPQ